MTAGKGDWSMVRKLCDVVCIMAVCLFCYEAVSAVGKIFASYEIAKTISYTVKAGDSFYSISNMFYEKDAKSDNFADFWVTVEHDNKHLVANGRILQIGDVVKINYYRKQ